METCVGVWNLEVEQAKEESLTSLCGAVYDFFQLRIHCAELTNMGILHQVRLCTVYPLKILTLTDQPNPNLNEQPQNGKLIMLKNI